MGEVAPGHKDPETQGCFCAAWGLPREPPNWHPAHKSKEFIEGWLNGWDRYTERAKNERRRDNKSN